MDTKKKERCYFVIDMKSFFASVECSLRGLDPMTTDLVVADAERSETTKIGSCNTINESKRC